MLTMSFLRQLGNAFMTKKLRISNHKVEFILELRYNGRKRTGSSFCVDLV